MAAYDRISGWYDLLEGLWEKRARHKGLRMLNVGKGETVLEIGFATGDSIIELARSVGEEGRVFGIDLSPKMTHLCETRVSEQDLAGRVDLITGDAAFLPFQSNIFNAIFMSFTLELFDTPEIPVLLNECRRVLSESGRICVVSLSMEGGHSLMRNIYEWGHDKFPAVIDCRPIFVRASLEESGFSIVEGMMTSVGGLPVEIVLAAKKTDNPD